MTEHTEDEPPVDVEALGWEAPKAPAGFADRVVAEFVRDAAVPPVAAPSASTRWRWLGAAAIAVAAAGLWFVVAASGRGPLSDSFRAEALRTVELADRAVAVVQPGSALEWEVDEDGAARVSQTEGRVFYRVDDGRPFEVKTPAGTVSVTGTCFEVDLTSPLDEREHRPMKKQGLKAGALGAALASAIVVTVYEGRVVLANERGQVSVGAGERARAEADRAPSRWGDDGERGAADPDGAANALPAGADPVATLRRQAQDLERLRAEKLAQTEQIEALRAQVESLGGSPQGDGPEAIQARAKKCAIASRNGDCPFLEPDQATLEEMARCGTVKYEYPSFLQDFDTPQTQGYAEGLGLTDPKELEAFQAVAEQHHAHYNEQLRALYVELGGDPDLAAESSANAMQGFIEDQLDRDLAAQVQRQIAEERAGLREASASDAEVPLEERFWRLRAEMGNDFERRLGEAMGQDRARELRRQHDGWPGSTSVHSSDCVDP